MINNDELEKIDLYFDTGTMIVRSCYCINKLHLFTPSNIRLALGCLNLISGELEDILIQIREGFSQVLHDHIDMLLEEEAPDVRYGVTLNYVDDLLENLMDAFDKGRVGKKDMTEKVNFAMRRVNHSLNLIENMKKI